MSEPERPPSHCERGLASGFGDACHGRSDTDCDGFVTANDVLRILRFLAGDALPQPTGCAQIGSPLSG